VREARDREEETVANPGDVLEMAELGLRVVIRRTAEETGGELVEFDVVGRPRGFLAGEHVHARQDERLTVVEGDLRLAVGGAEEVLGAGQSRTVPAGTPHAQRPGPAPEGTVRVEVRPAARTEAFLERVAELSRSGQLTRRGYPRPLAGAALVRDFGDEGHATRPPVAVQRALATGMLAAAGVLRRLRERARHASRDYVFVDQWSVDAPIEHVHAAIADGRTYTTWWQPVYIDVESDGPPAVGKVSRQHFKGRLPYHLHTRATLIRLEPPRVIEVDVDGDLRGRGLWTLTPEGPGTHVRFDWHVTADRPLLRMLTPLLRPLLRWNHAWAIARAREGLEPYARAQAAAAAPPAAVG
jgi:mannose-6-phosphate isomerase-like protein (cupin superfamily)